MKLAVRNLCVDRTGHRIVSGISFELGAGEALVTTGPNGSGKSTLLRAIAGLLPVADGEIELDGCGEGLSREYCHYLGHKNGLKSTLTVAENLEFWREFCGQTGLVVPDALEQLGL